MAVGLKDWYSEELTSIIIPSEHNGLPVTEIGFLGREMICINSNDPTATFTYYGIVIGHRVESITIPQTIRYIDAEAFDFGYGFFSLEVFFADPTGWQYRYINDWIDVPEETLRDPQTAAAFLWENRNTDLRRVESGTGSE